MLRGTNKVRHLKKVKTFTGKVFDRNTSACVGVCALTRRPLLQQSISSVTIDSVLFGWLCLLTILFLLLH